MRDSSNHQHDKQEETVTRVSPHGLRTGMWRMPKAEAAIGRVVQPATRMRTENRMARRHVP